MTWVLVVWFWTGYPNAAASLVSVPGFTSKAACDKAAVDMTRGMKANGSYFNKLYIVCEKQ
jgi:hypothetical protein